MDCSLLLVTTSDEEIVVALEVYLRADAAENVALFSVAIV